MSRKRYRVVSVLPIFDPRLRDNYGLGCSRESSIHLRLDEPNAANASHRQRDAGMRSLVLAVLHEWTARARAPAQPHRNDHRRQEMEPALPGLPRSVRFADRRRWTARRL